MEPDAPTRGRRRGRKKAEEPLQPIKKMTCKYGRNPSVSSGRCRSSATCAVALPPQSETNLRRAAPNAFQVDAEEDVFKKTFYVAEERIRIIYHYHNSRITRSQRIYTNDNAQALRHITQVHPSAGHLDWMLPAVGVAGATPV